MWIAFTLDLHTFRRQLSPFVLGTSVAVCTVAGGFASRRKRVSRTCCCWTKAGLITSLKSLAPTSEVQETRLVWEPPNASFSPGTHPWSQGVAGALCHRLFLWCFLKFSPCRVDSKRCVYRSMVGMCRIRLTLVVHHVCVWKQVAAFLYHVKTGLEAMGSVLFVSREEARPRQLNCP